MKYYTRYNPPPSPTFRAVGKSRTRQEFKAECDINCILAKMGAGLLAPLQAPQPVYSDLDAVPKTYEDCMAVIIDADERFAALPARVRDRFGNSAQAFLEFIGNKDNLDEAIKLGLIEKPTSTSVPASELKTESVS